MRLIERFGARETKFTAMILACVLVVACVEQTPTAVQQGILPGEPVTIEIQIPWSEFGSNLEVFGGYGSPQDLGQGVVANAFGGTLNARTLVRFESYPTQATVRDTTGTDRPDFDLTYIGGRLVAFFDTIGSTNSGPVTLRLGATSSEWDAGSASWDFALDTVNDQRSWPEAGAGPVADLGTVLWNPILGDSVSFPLDSAAVAAWADTTDLGVGARIDLVDVGPSLRIRNASLRLSVRPSLDPDTLIEVTANPREVTFVYDPEPGPPAGIRIGGAPAWRTVLDIAMPVTLNGPPELCAVISCPHVLTPAQISQASLVLTTTVTDPAFQPTDSVGLDARPVSDRSAMPKSPLGSSLLVELLGRRVRASAFGVDAGELVEIPFTPFARDQIRGEDEDGDPALSTLALLSIFEPASLSFATFEGPGSANAPFLRLVLTIGPSVELP